MDLKCPNLCGIVVQIDKKGNIKVRIVFLCHSIRFDFEFDFEFDSISGRGATTQRITAVTRIFTGSVDGILSNSAHLIGTHGK